MTKDIRPKILPSKEVTDSEWNANNETKNIDCITSGLEVLHLSLTHVELFA